MNSVVYHIACFMILREPTIWRWSHARHHTDTIIVGRDPEIAVPRPPRLFDLILNLFALKSGAIALRKLLLHARNPRQHLEGRTEVVGADLRYRRLQLVHA